MVIFQHNMPEKNLYAYKNFKIRGEEKAISIFLPFFGEWTVTQGHDGEYTHKDEWRHAWDFEIFDENGKSYSGDGNYCEDYYCYNKDVLAPAKGVVEEVVDKVEDNIIGEKNLVNNWGNTVIIKHDDFTYSKLSHLKPGSIVVKKGQHVELGETVGRCGNSGLSPYPPLHFQLQNFPYVGAPTVNYPLSSFIRINKDNIDFCSNTVPEDRDIVSNIKSNSIVRNIFNIVPGKKFKWEVITEGEKQIYNWDVYSLYESNYIYCRETKSSAYFKSDDSVLRFEYFKGSKKSLLYYFYLAFYKVQTGLYKGLEISDELPVDKVFGLNKRFWQDFISPFYIYLKAEYHMKYVNVNEDFNGVHLHLESAVVAKKFKKDKYRISFSVNITDNGIDDFKIRDNNKIIEAKCISC